MRQPKEIEFAFLGCIFDNPPTRIPDALKVKANIDWFSDQSCRLVWAAIDSIRRKTATEKIRPLVIIDEAIRLSNRKKSPFYGFKISTDFIDEAKKFRDAAEEDETTTIAAYAPILQEAAIGRKLNEAMDSARVEGKYSSNSVRMMELAKQIQQIQKDESPESGIDVGTLLDNMQESYDKGYEEYAVNHNYSYVPGIPFPWDCMSHLTEGLNPGLHIIAARPSVGKTSFILQCMNYWCELGYKVAFDCLDMSVTEMIKRPVANLSWVSPRRMKFGWATPEEQYRVREVSKQVRAWGDNGLLTVTLEPDVDKLKAWAEIRHRAGKLDILVIDFAQRFRLKGTSSEYEIVTYASGVLKQLANECLMPIVLLSQLSRDNVKDPNGKRPPELSDLRGSGALEQDATSVVLLHKEAEIITQWRAEPPLYYVEQSDDPRLNSERSGSIAAVTWNLAKNQNGATGQLPFVVFQNCFRWYVGDEDGEKAAKFQKIQADWRFLEQPFTTAEKNGAVVYPDFWTKKCAEFCGKLGLEIPSHIRDQLEKWDVDRYNKLISEHNERMRLAKEAVVSPIQLDEAPPSIVKMTVEATEEDEKNKERMTDETINTGTDIDKHFETHIPSNTESDAGGEPGFDDNFFPDEHF